MLRKLLGAVVGYLAMSVFIAVTFGVMFTALAGIVFVFGLALAIRVLISDAPAEQRTADITASESAGKARQPGWVAVLNPFVGAAGILLGSRLRRPEES